MSYPGHPMVCSKFKPIISCTTWNLYIYLLRLLLLFYSTICKKICVCSKYESCFLLNFVWVKAFGSLFSWNILRERIDLNEFLQTVNFRLVCTNTSAFLPPSSLPDRLSDERRVMREEKCLAAQHEAVLGALICSLCPVFDRTWLEFIKIHLMNWFTIKNLCV